MCRNFISWFIRVLITVFTLFVVPLYFYIDVIRFYVPTSAWFVVPDGCYCPVQFLFGVLIFVDFTCLFGVDKFQVHGSVHRCNNFE